jgi:transcriptional regulator with XRE-family HTH domain
MISRMKKHDLLIHIGKRIRDLRKEKGISQEELARKAKLDRSYLGSIERGERNISVLTLDKIGNALDIKIVNILA